VRTRIAPRALALVLAAAATLGAGHTRPAPPTPAYPIRHVVVIFQENVSFDHYFGTYPHAINPPGEPRFLAARGTPAAHGLTHALLTSNPNFTNTANGTGAANPFRLDRTQAATADQSHSYRPEQQAFDAGHMDLFPLYTGRKGAPLQAAPGATKGLVMGYFDGNTVTALWNYAQHFALSDNSFNTTFGPSTPGAINLVSGQTDGVGAVLNGPGPTIPDGAGGVTLIGDPDPYGDVCSTSTHTTVQMTGRNIGDLLNAAGVSWGFFEGGFDLALVNPNHTTGCDRATHSEVTGITSRDYTPHHEPFQFYASTANPTHARPTSVAAIGQPRDPISHNQYDLHDFFDALTAGNFPAVSFLKAPSFQDGHAGNSDPLDEQAFIVRVLNFLQARPEWNQTAVFIAYDDSDGWYDHVSPPLVNPSFSPDDALNAPGRCGAGTPLSGLAGRPAQGRCGYGPRLPLLVVSPWAKANFIDHHLSDQTSILRFIEDVFLKRRRIGGGSFDAKAGSLDSMFDFAAPDPPNPTHLWLDPATGEPSSAPASAAAPARPH